MTNYFLDPSLWNLKCFCEWVLVELFIWWLVFFFFFRIGNLGKEVNLAH